MVEAVENHSIADETLVHGTNFLTISNLQQKLYYCTLVVLIVVSDVVVVVVVFFCILGLVVVKLIAGDDSASSPLSPVMGYGHFNVSNKDGKICILLDLSCSVSVQVNNTVSLVVNNYM